MQSIFRSAPRCINRSIVVRQSPLRPFTAATTLRLKEDKAQDPHELDAKKHEQIQKQKEGKGEWHEELASGAESNIAADRQKVNDHDEHMEDLQKETAGQSEKNHPEGKA
jgi:hypothetical protein